MTSSSCCFESPATFSPASSSRICLARLRASRSRKTARLHVDWPLPINETAREHISCSTSAICGPLTYKEKKRKEKKDNSIRPSDFADMYVYSKIHLRHIIKWNRWLCHGLNTMSDSGHWNTVPQRTLGRGRLPLYIQCQCHRRQSINHLIFFSKSHIGIKVLSILEIRQLRNLP